MNKFDILKLAPTLSAKERAKLLITSWHEAILGKQTFSQADTQALTKFENASEDRQCRYYLVLYKHGYFTMRNLVEQTFLKIALFNAELSYFHKALGMDYFIAHAISALEDLPTFVSDKDFNQKRLQEIVKYKGQKNYWETDELFAISFDSEQIEGADNHLPFKQELRKFALDNCKKLLIINKSFELGKAKLHINETTPFTNRLREIVKALEIQIQLFKTYKEVIEILEQDLDLPLFDSKTCEQIEADSKLVDEIVKNHNQTLEKLEKLHGHIIPCEIEDKENYLLKVLPTLTADRDKLVKDIRDLSEYEVSLIYG